MKVRKLKFKDRQTGEYRLTPKFYIDIADHTGQRRKIPGFENEKATEKLGKALVDLVARRKGGVEPDWDWLHGLPGDVQKALVKHGLAEAGWCPAVKRPEPKEPLLIEQIDAYAKWMRATKADHGFHRCPKYVKDTMQRIREVVDGCGFRTFADIDRKAVELFLDTHKTPGGKELARATYNGYVCAIKGFCEWVIGDRDIASPLKNLGRRKKPKAKRRGLNTDEVCRLLEATANGPIRAGMAPLDRAVLYLLAIETGYRVRELTHLRVGSFDLDEAVVKQEAQYVKNRDLDGARQLIKRTRAEQLRAYFAGRDSDELAFPTMVSSGHTAQLLAADLEAAGIDVVNSEGQKVLFHCLRYTLAGALDQSRATLKERKMIMRHKDRSDLTLDTYTTLQLIDLRGAVERLPEYPWPGDVLGQQKQRAG